MAIFCVYIIIYMHDYIYACVRLRVYALVRAHDK